MRKNYLKLLIVFTALLMPHLLTGQTKVLEDGFENGLSSWTQENVIGTNKWTIQTGNNLYHPKGAFEGNSRAYFQTNNQNPSVTKLITPKLDFTILRSPAIIFHYALASYPSGAHDNLRVYIRFDEKDEWIPLKEYKNVTSNWTIDTIKIEESEFLMSKEVQIAFEGEDNGGHGIVIDKIFIGNLLDCPSPTAISATEITSNSARLVWTGSPDGSKYHLKVSSTEIEDFTQQADIEDVEELQNNSFWLTKLKPSTKYYVYIKTDCSEIGLGNAEWVKGTFTSGCIPIDFTTAESFEELTPGEGKSLGCWKGLIDVNSSMTPPLSYYPHIVQNDNENKYTIYGNYSARIYGYYSDNNWTYGYLVSPEIESTVDLSLKMVTFSMYSTNTNYKLTVGMQTDPDDVSTFTPIHTVSCDSASVIQEFNIYLNEYTKGGRYLSFMVDGGLNKTSATVYIDNIKLENLPQCDELVISNYNHTTGINNAEMTWLPLNSNKWNIKISKGELIDPENQEGDQSLWNSNKNPLTGTPKIELNNLSGNTKYFVYIQPVCEDGVIGKWSKHFLLRTKCGSQGIPLYENFNEWGQERNGTNNAFPDCWIRHDNRNAGGGWPYISWLSTFYEGGSLFFTTDTDQWMWAATPELEVDHISEVIVTFMFLRNKSNTKGNISVGVMEDPDDITTFEPVFSFGTYNTDKYQEITINFDSYRHSGKHIAIHVEKGAQFSIDNFNIIERPTCLKVGPDIKIAEKKPTSIKLDFTSQGSETAWDIAFGKPGFQLDGTDFTTVTITSLDDEIGPLVQNTDYEFYVRANCGNSDVSEWRGPISATTRQTPATIPYFYGFEETNEKDNPDNWSFSSSASNNKWVIGDATGDQSARSLYISNDKGVSNAYSIDKAAKLYAYRSIWLDEGIYDFSFVWKSVGETNDFGRVILLPEEVDITNIDHDLSITTTGIPTAAATALDNATTLRLNNTWKKEETTFTLTKEGVYKILFYWNNNAGVGEQPPIAIDSVKFTSNTTLCETPLNISVLERTHNSIKIGFNSYNTATWDVKISGTLVKPENVDTEPTQTWIEEANITETEYKFENLTHEKKYYYYIKLTDCQNIPWIVDSTFTLCNPITLPYVQNFEGYGNTTGTKYPTNLNSIVPDCWARQSTRTDRGNPYIITSKKSEGEASLYFYNSSTTHYAYGVTPPIDVHDMSVVRVSFQYMNAGSTSSIAELKVGVTSDPDNMNDFEPLYTIDNIGGNNSVFHPIEIWFNNYAGDKKYIAFLASKYSIYIDELVIDSIPGCPAPKDLEVETTADNKTILKWQGVADSYKILVSKVPFDEFDENIHTYAYEGTSNTPNAEISGLHSATVYYAKVQSICGGEDAEWSLTQEFRSACWEKEILPYKENFASYKGTSTSPQKLMPPCMHSVQQYSNYPSLVSNNNVSNSPNALILSSYEKTPVIAAFPKMNIDHVNKLTISGMYKRNHQFVVYEVGVITDLDDPDSFILYDTIKTIAGTAYNKFEIPLTQYQGEDGYIAIRGRAATNGGENRGYFDDIEIKETAKTCAFPYNLRIRQIKSNSVIVQWSGNQRDYIIKYSTQEFDPRIDTEKVTEVNANQGVSYTLTNLQPNTKYYFYVQAKCSDEDSDWSEQGQFTTLCLPIAAPYAENFDTHGQPTGTSDSKIYPVCWNFVETKRGSPSTIYNNLPFISIFSTTESDNKFLRCLIGYSKSSSTNVENFSIYDSSLPELNDDLTKYQVSFRYSTSKEYNSGLIIGVLRDWQDAASFTPIDTVFTYGEMDGKKLIWKEHVTNFKNYKGAGKYISFRTRGDLVKLEQTEILIDSVKITLTPECAIPYNVRLKEATPDGGIFKWENANNNHNEFIYAVTDTLLTFEETNDWQTIMDKQIFTKTISDTKDTIKNLNGGETYYFYIRSSCSEDAYFPAPIKFVTYCTPINVFPHYESFYSDTIAGGINSTYPPCWRRIQNFALTAGTLPKITVHTLTKDTALQVYSYSSKNTIAISPILDVADMSKMRIRFKAMVGNYNTLNTKMTIGFIEDPTREDTFVATDTIELTKRNEWHNLIINFDEYTGDAKHIAFNILPQSSTTDYFIKDLYIEEIPAVPCDMPAEIVLEDVTESIITLSWPANPLNKWEIVYGEPGFDADTVIHNKLNATQNKTAISGLTPNRYYQFRVRVDCGNEHSEWSDIKEVKTLQQSAPIPYHCYFEDEFDNSQWSFITDRNTDNNWVIGSGTSDPANGKSIYISGDGSSYKFEKTKVTHYPMAYRLIDIPEGRYTISYKRKGTGSTSNYMRILLIPDNIDLIRENANGIGTSYAPGSSSTGACQSASSPHPWGWINLGEITPGSSCSTEYYYLYDKMDWTKFSDNIHIPGGKYKILLFWRGSSIEKDGTETGAYPPPALDSLEIIPFTGCLKPEFVQAVNITANSAELLDDKETRVKNQTYRIKVSSVKINDPSTNNGDIISDAQTKLPLPLTGLNPDQVYYYYYIQTDCGGNTWTEKTFKTSCNTAINELFEDFTGLNALPLNRDCWEVKEGLIKDVFDNPVNLGSVHRVNRLWTHYWRGYTPLAGPQACVILESREGPYSMWLITPSISLPEDSETNLSFDLGHTQAMGNTTKPKDPRKENQFMVIVSEDNGLTWKRENATIWNNDGTGDHVLLDLPTGFEKINMDISKYAGKTIKIGFVGEAGYQDKWHHSNSDSNNANSASIKITNVSVKCAEKLEYDDEVFQGYAYSGYGINIPGSELDFAGDTVITRTIPSSGSSCDSIVTLNLTVIGNVQKDISDTFCNGEEYNKNGIKTRESGEYTHYFSLPDGRDSIIHLTLSELPKYEYTTKMYACPESLPVKWRNKEYSTHGLHEEKLTSSTGCDSIYILDLIVTNEISSEINHTICTGNSYKFGDQILTKEGDYEHVFESSLGCDSTVYLHLIVQDEISIYKEVTICVGGSFTGYGFTDITEPREYSNGTQLSQAGCDSTFTLRLLTSTEVTTTINDMVCRGDIYERYGFKTSIPGEHREKFIAVNGGCDSIVILYLEELPTYTRKESLTIGRNQLPHNYNGYEIPEGAVSGEIQIDLKTKLGCDSIIFLDLTVTEPPVKLFDYISEDLIIEPNPVIKGGKININYPFTPEELKDMKIEVFNSIGVCIKIIEPKILQLSISDINTSGMYLIRITTGLNTEMYGKVIVQ